MKSKGKDEQISLLDNNGNLENIITKNLDAVLHESMIPYSEHVILDRALPRVEDGLKPVQRRILYTMLDLGVTPDKPYRKSARIVGDCLGKYHPHGDTSVYDAMVRMAQDFNMRERLVDGHGNFGSVDGDSAAAMRYTEVRMMPLALELLRDLEKDTVSWSFNFDDTLKEPDMLPAAFPNLLVNGATGIAVGLATNIPTHNLGEAIDATICLIDNPKATLDDVMKVMPAPDFSTGGYIISGEELRQAYETGKGKILIRSKYFVEGDQKKSIVITEIPYQVNKASFLQKIATLRDGSGKAALSGIAEIRDESDRNGMRAVLRLKKDVDPQPIINYLLKYSDLQCTFGINMVAIANGKPVQLGVMQILKYYIDYRQGVIVRRSKYELEIAKERAHIIKGLLIAIKNIDEVIKIIKKSSSTSEAKVNLRNRFELSERQAQAILDMRLAKLTSLEIYKLEEELAELEKKIEELTQIINSTKKQLQVVKSELLAVKKVYKTPRRSTILKKADDVVVLPTEKDVVREVILGFTASQTIKVIPPKNYAMTQKEFGSNSTLYECHQTLIETTTDQTAFLFTNLGNCYKVKLSEIDECKFKDKGTPISRLVALDKNEKVVNVFVFNSFNKNKLTIFTKQGMVKISPLSEYNVAKASFAAIKLKEDDEVISVSLDSGEIDTFIAVTKQGNILNITNDVAETGRTTAGVKLVALNDGDTVLFAETSNGEGEVITVTNKAYAKRTIIGSIDVLPRNRKGVKVTPFTKENGSEIAFASVVKFPYHVVIQDINGITISKYSEDIQIAQRTAVGKSVTRGKSGLVVQTVCKFKTDYESSLKKKGK